MKKYHGHTGMWMHLFKTVTNQLPNDGPPRTSSFRSTNYMTFLPIYSSIQSLGSVSRYPLIRNPTRESSTGKMAGEPNPEIILIARLVAGFQPRRPGFEPTSGHVGFVVDKVALGQVFSEYFGFPFQFSFNRLLHTHHLSSGAGTKGQLVADKPSRLNLIPPQKKKISLTHDIQP
jgi:hypothetical protein